jgi:transposase
LEGELDQMRRRLAELEDRLRANSSNSSTAPSSNPLWAPKLKPDRFGIHDRLKINRRAVCWAHLKRDFQRWIDRGGVTLWLRRITAPLRKRRLLQRGIACGVAKAKHFCRHVLKVEEALWTFARREGIETTNNHAERMLRGAVISRKTCFGSHSQEGCRYVERILTTLATLRLRRREPLAFLTQALTRIATPSLRLCLVRVNSYEYSL